MRLSSAGAPDSQIGSPAGHASRQSCAVSVVRSLSLPQRIVVVVAVGLAFLAGWIWWYSGDVPSSDGWFAYAPNTATATDTYHLVRERQPEHLAIPLVLIGVWTALSLWLLAPSSGAPEET